MTKKKTAPSPKRPVPTLSFEEIGSGITKRRVPIFAGLTLPEEIAIRRSLTIPLPNTLNFAVKVASRFLNKYGIEYRPEGEYHTEDGRTHTLVGHVEAIGHRAYESPVWYSASIFQFWLHMREAIAKGNAESAAVMGFEIGLLHAEARLKGKYEEEALAAQRSRDGAAKGGKQDKRLPPVGKLVRHLIRRNRKATATELWEMLPTDQINGIKISGYKFYRNGGRLLATRKMDGCKDWRPVGKALKLSAFKKRVGKERTPSAR